MESMYAEVGKSEIPFITYENKMFVCDPEHKWGESPFHYIRDLYIRTIDSLRINIFVPFYILDRCIKNMVMFSFKKGQNALPQIFTNGSMHDIENYLRFNFNAPQRNYFCRFTIQNKEYNGFSIRFRLKGWKGQYKFTLGFLYDGTIYKIHGRHCEEGEWVTMSIGQKDIVFLLDNPNAPAAEAVVNDARFIMMGDFDKEAYIDVAELVFWKEDPSLEKILPSILMPHKNDNDIIGILIEYKSTLGIMKRQNCDEFFKKGKMPITHISLDWPVFQDFTTDFGKVTTFEWSYLALHPVVFLLLGWLETGSLGHLCAAREFTSLWLEKFYHSKPSRGIEYHEHGAAERLISLCFMYLIGRKEGFDYRFQTRLAGAIFQHAQLMANESFYVRHQAIRFHNHGMFQDIALLLTAQIFPDWSGSSYWKNLALHRLEAMFNHIYVEDGDCRISFENSYGYHIAGIPIAELISSLLKLTKETTSLLSIPTQMDNFSKYFQWTHKRFPAFGDTFRYPQTHEKALDARKNTLSFVESLDKPIFRVFRKAGYAVVRGFHQEEPYKLVFIASCLSKTHKHCDNLSFSLFFDGIEWFIDPSFYNHEYNSGYAAYLRSAAAHNNLYLEDSEYSIELGLASVDGTSEGEVFAITGEHRCYADHVVKRKIAGSLSELCFNFDDSVSPYDGTVKMRLHCGEFVDAQQNNGNVILTHPASKYALHIQTGLPCTIIKGKHDYPMGGISGTNFCQTSVINTLEFVAPSGFIGWKCSALPA